MKDCCYVSQGCGTATWQHPTEGSMTMPCTLGNSCPTVAPTCQAKKLSLYEKQQIEKESAMYANCNYAVAACNPNQDDTVTRRNYFTSRLRELKVEKADDLRVKFGFDDEAAPKTKDELIERIKAGRFIFRNADIESDGYDYETDHYFGGLANAIRWRTEKKDEAGFNKAFEALTAAFDLATDQLYAGSEPLKVLSDFQAWTYKA